MQCEGPVSPLSQMSHTYHGVKHESGLDVLQDAGRQSLGEAPVAFTFAKSFLKR